MGQTEGHNQPVHVLDTFPLPSGCMALMQPCTCIFLCPCVWVAGAMAAIRTACLHRHVGLQLQRPSISHFTE